MNRKALTLATLALLSGQALAADVINHKSPYCGCCTEWTKHMQDAGFNVDEKLHENMNPIKLKLGITPELASCHTAEINGYVFEGHIPAEDIKAFLENPPRNAKGSRFQACRWVHQVWNMAMKKMSILYMHLMKRVRYSLTDTTKVINNGFC